MLAERLKDHDDTPRDDQIVVLRGMNWSDYERLLEVRGEASVPRLSYLEGDLEIMTPSLPHESIKSRIGRLVEVWCLERGVEFEGCGSWTIKSKEKERGLEPDESYVFGAFADPLRPDLAIEVVWTSGGVRKLDIYKQLGVQEVWFWRKNRISVHLLRDGEYVEAPVSQVLPGIDLPQLLSFLDRPTSSQAIREYRAALSASQR